MIRDQNLDRDVVIHVWRNNFVNLLITTLHNHYEYNHTNRYKLWQRKLNKRFSSPSTSYYLISGRIIVFWSMFLHGWENFDSLRNTTRKAEKIKYIGHED
jgi:hypothetical protein